MTTWRLRAPLGEEEVRRLRTGDRVIWSGTLYTARDAAHARLVAALRAGEELSLPLRGQVIYYVGPSPARPGQVIGAAGPTSSYRMDPYTPELLAAGVRALIGKGVRGTEVREALREHAAVYLAAIGGLGAYLGRRITAAEVFAYPELGPEAIFRLEVEDFPTLVVNDVYGGDLYLEGRAAYARLQR